MRFRSAWSGRPVASTGDLTAFDPLTAGIFGRNETDPSHELLGAIEAMQIADFGNERDAPGGSDRGAVITAGETYKKTTRVQRSAQSA